MREMRIEGFLSRPPGRLREGRFAVQTAESAAGYRPQPKASVKHTRSFLLLESQPSPYTQDVLSDWVTDGLASRARRAQQRPRPCYP
jgi:hypothetical protein